MTEPTGPTESPQEAGRRFLREHMDTIRRQSSSPSPPEPPPPTLLVVPNTGPTIYHRAFNRSMAICLRALVWEHRRIGDIEFRQPIRTPPIWGQGHEGSQAQWYDHEKDEGWGFILAHEYRTDGGVGGQWLFNPVRGLPWMRGEFRVPRVCLRQNRRTLGFVAEPREARGGKPYIPGMITFQDALEEDFRLDEMLDASERGEPPPWER